MMFEVNMTLQPDSHLKVGMKAPDFCLPGSPTGNFRLGDELKKGSVFVYFFVSDFGPLCNIVMKNFASRKDEFDRKGVQFVGISVDDPRMHGVWKESLKIKVRLLSDEEGEVARSYGVLMEDELYFKMANRAIFLVDSGGIIRYRWVAKDPAYEPDYEAAFEAVRSLQDMR
jgi:peroxiredoxin